TQVLSNLCITLRFQRLGSTINYQCNCSGCNILSAPWCASAGKPDTFGTSVVEPA
ncbi:hypothetical protein PILCRDRAFT_828270, partial [Piloderma croceum F 1598]